MLLTSFTNYVKEIVPWAGGEKMRPLTSNFTVEAVIKVVEN